MSLSTFVFVLLVFCIPYLSYIRNSIQPRQGFSILFISLISLIALLKFDLLIVVSLLLVIISIFMKKQLVEISLFATSFLILNIILFSGFEVEFLTYILNYLLPISLISGIFSLMMIGHWFLVDPTISKEGMKKIAIVTSVQPLLIIPLVYFNYLSDVISPTYKLVIIFLYLSTGVLSFASYKSLNEKSYTGVMAATGLSYLSLIVSIGASGTLLLLS
ncbi:MAG: hypothetical protein VYD43_01755 [Actinomycetota bacterium]|nr:hypothetical protein [Actinomycetota bacterium]|tara:strand:+ start:486 stop:1139 length:654 start_codon:yes stop_codon:yes gene_type:complete